MAIKIKPHKLKDRNFRSSLQLYPEEMIANYRLAGKVIKVCEVKFKNIKNEEVEPDALAYMEVTIKRSKQKRIYNLEHQSYIVDEDRLKTIKKVVDAVKAKYHYPIEVYIITSIPPEKHTHIYEETYSDVLRVQFIYISLDDIRKMLNNINNKIENNEKISDRQALHLVVALIFAPYKERKKIHKQVIDILKREKTIQGQIRVDIVEFVEQFNGKTFTQKTKSELSNMSYEEIEKRKMAMRILYEDELNEKTNQINQQKSEMQEKENKLSNIEKTIKKVLDMKGLNPEVYKILSTLIVQ